MANSNRALLKHPLSWFKDRSHPLDRVAITVLLGLSLLTVVLLVSGSHTGPRIREFSWAGQAIAARDTAFTMTFSRPMDRQSVEQGLKIEPALSGKFSWAGRRMAYTLKTPAEYGQTFKLQLVGAKERFNQGSQMLPFETEFSSRDRMFAFIGAADDQVERLVLTNMTSKDKQVLTPQNLKVLDFYAYPDRERIVFSALDRNSPNATATEQRIYSVTTGLGKTAAGEVELLLDNDTHQNLRFALSDDGSVIVVQRVNRKNTNDFAPWILRPNQPPQQLKTDQPGGEFVITPDSSAIAIAQGQGMAILSLENEEAKPLGFLPRFGNVLSFSRDGSQAAMLKFNNDFTRSLYLVTNQGIQKEILKITGSIREAIFDPTQRFLFCLLTELQDGEEFKEQPYLAVIDIATALEDPKLALKPLVKLPQQREIQVSLAPDGRALLFDQTENDPNVSEQTASLKDSRLWILPTETLLAGDWSTDLQPIDLVAGFHPRWLP